MLANPHPVTDDLPNFTSSTLLDDADEPRTHKSSQMFVINSSGVTRASVVAPDSRSLRTIPSSPDASTPTMANSTHHHASSPPNDELLRLQTRSPGLPDPSGSSYSVNARRSVDFQPSAASAQPRYQVNYRGSNDPTLVPQQLAEQPHRGSIASDGLAKKYFGPRAMAEDDALLSDIERTFMRAQQRLTALDLKDGAGRIDGTSTTSSNRKNLASPSYSSSQSQSQPSSQHASGQPLPNGPKKQHPYFRQQAMFGQSVSSTQRPHAKRVSSPKGMNRNASRVPSQPQPQPQPQSQTQPQGQPTLVGHTSHDLAFEIPHQVNPATYHYDDSTYEPESYLERIALGLVPQSLEQTSSPTSNVSQSDSKSLGKSETKTPRQGHNSPSKQSSQGMSQSSEAARFKSSYFAPLPKLPPDDILVITRTIGPDGKVVPVNPKAQKDPVLSVLNTAPAGNHQNLARETKIGLRRAREEEKMRARERAWREAMMGIVPNDTVSTVSTPREMGSNSHQASPEVGRQPSSSGSRSTAALHQNEDDYENPDYDNESLAASYRRTVQNPEGFGDGLEPGAEFGAEDSYRVNLNEDLDISGLFGSPSGSQPSSFGSLAQEQPRSKGKVPGYLAQTTSSNRKQSPDPTGPAPLGLRQSTPSEQSRRKCPPGKPQSLPPAVRASSANQSTVRIITRPTSERTPSNPSEEGAAQKPTSLRLEQKAKVRELLQEQQAWDAKHKALRNQDRKQKHEALLSFFRIVHAADTAKLAEECRRGQEEALRKLAEEQEARRQEALKRKHERKRDQKRLELKRAEELAEAKRQQQEEETRRFNELIREIEEKKQQAANQFKQYRESESRLEAENLKRKYILEMQSQKVDPLMLPILASNGRRIMQGDQSAVGATRQRPSSHKKVTGTASASTTSVTQNSSTTLPMTDRTEVSHVQSGSASTMVAEEHSQARSPRTYSPVPSSGSPRNVSDISANLDQPDSNYSAPNSALSYGVGQQ